jgi:hypothetical protein
VCEAHEYSRPSLVISYSPSIRTSPRGTCEHRRAHESTREKRMPAVVAVRPAPESAHSATRTCRRSITCESDTRPVHDSRRWKRRSHHTCPASRLKMSALASNRIASGRLMNLCSTRWRCSTRPSRRFGQEKRVSAESNNPIQFRRLRCTNRHLIHFLNRNQLFKVQHHVNSGRLKTRQSHFISKSHNLRNHGSLKMMSFTSESLSSRQFDL